MQMRMGEVFDLGIMGNNTIRPLAFNVNPSVDYENELERNAGTMRTLALTPVPLSTGAINSYKYIAFIGLGIIALLLITKRSNKK